jgi:hypothetical protein
MHVWIAHRRSLCVRGGELEVGELEAHAVLVVAAFRRAFLLRAEVLEVQRLIVGVWASDEGDNGTAARAESRFASCCCCSSSSLASSASHSALY